MRVKRFYRFLFGGLLLIAVILGGLYGLDQRLHRKFDKIATLNEAGYRGPLVGPKLPGEKRIFVMGASTTLGYGVYPDQTIAAYLDQILNANADNGVRYSVVNLGFNYTGAAALPSDIRHYSYLEPDVVLLYTGYGDLAVNKFMGRHDSIVFRMTGYYPVAPLIISEKANLIRYNSWGRWSQAKTVFRPARSSEPSQTAWPAPPTPAPLTPKAPPLNRWDWSHYCEQVKSTINAALGENTRVIVVTEPYLSPQHFDQQEALRQMLKKEFGSERRVTYVDLGQIFSPSNPEFGWDGMHLNALGNRTIAEKLAPVIPETLR